MIAISNRQRLLQTILYIIVLLAGEWLVSDVTVRNVALPLFGSYDTAVNVDFYKSRIPSTCGSYSHNAEFCPFQSLEVFLDIVQ